MSLNSGQFIVLLVPDCKVTQVRNILSISVSSKSSIIGSETSRDWRWAGGGGFFAFFFLFRLTCDVFIYILSLMGEWND